MKTFFNIKLFHALIAVIFLMSVFPGVLCAADTDGYNCVFFGHSFFRPVAEGFEEHAKRAGFADHFQVTIFAGGEKGSPGQMWTIDSNRIKVQAAFDDEIVDLVGMTMHRVGSEIEDYSRWIDFANDINPQTMFFIGRPWMDRPGDVTASEYETNTHANLGQFYEFMQTLRDKYPENIIFTIPYGEAAVELRNLYDEGELPEIRDLISEDPDVMGLHRDSLGHAFTDGPLLPLSRLVWLGVIYEYDLLSYGWDAGFSVDLKPIAQKIVDEAQYADLDYLNVSVSSKQSMINKNKNIQISYLPKSNMIQFTSQNNNIKNVGVSIYTIAGKLVFDKKNICQPFIRCPRLSAGLYLVAVNSGEYKQTASIIINK